MAGHTNGAIGLKAAHPDRTVVVGCGDGCYNLSGFELMTAVEHNLPVVTEHAGPMTPARHPLPPSMSIAASGEGDRVTTLELFFDLVYVFAFIQVTGLITHGDLPGSHDPGARVRFANFCSVLAAGRPSASSW